ncbi:MAG: hypothetical protein AB7N80_13310 [Bdellovibrionales bacterium]
MKSILALSLAVLFSQGAVAAECSAWIAYTTLPAIPKTPVTLTKNVDDQFKDVEKFSHGQDPVLKSKNLRVYIDINASNKAVSVSIGQMSGAAISIEGASFLSGKLISVFQYSSSEALTVSCKES